MILIGIAGVILSTLSFGFGRSFWWLIVSRCINGGQSGCSVSFSDARELIQDSVIALNGNVPAIKSGECPSPILLADVRTDFVVL